MSNSDPDGDMPAIDARSDRSLLRRFKAGEQDAATALYMRYARRLQALADKQTGKQLLPRFDADDVVQSVFRTFFRRAAGGFYEVPAGEELWQLLLVLALNKVRKLATHHRAQKRDAGRTVTMNGINSEAHGGDQMAHDTLRMVVDDVISELSPPHDRIVELRIEGHEIAEIAELTQRSNRTVERTLQLFRRQLAGLIDKEL